MKQGKSYFTVILWILLAAIAAYFGYNVVSSLYAPLMTATVTPYEAGAGYYASGFVVREEELLYSQYGTTVLNCAEGAHVAANDTVATGYRSEDAKTRQTRIDELSGQIEQLQYAWSAVSSVYDQAALDADIAGDLAQLSRYLALRDMNSVSDLSPELKGLILRRTGSDSDSGSLQARISTLQAELETLEAQSAGDTSAILAGKAGTFSAAVDGYESVLTPERLMEMTVAEFESVQPDETDANAIGRLVTSATWYYACVVPASELSGVEEGDRATLTFARDYYQPVTMRVARLGGNEAGSRLLVLSSDRALQNVTLLRQHEHVEAFVGADQGVDHTQRIARMHVVVDVAVHEQQVPLELACDLGVGAYVVDERRVSLFAHLLLDAVVRLAPPAVVDTVVMVARA